MSDTYIPGECCRKKNKPTTSILFGWVWINPTTIKTAPQSSKQSSRCHTPSWILRHEPGWRSYYPVKPCKVHKHFIDILYTPIIITFPLSGPFPVLIHVFVSLLLLMVLLFFKWKHKNDCSRPIKAQENNTHFKNHMFQVTCNTTVIYF